ncbi:hypothetical protein D1007_52404 [Hordeum vulgare]|nr:hypothetical protein D1007_52404 [Hordeum vulgare]
MVGPASGSWEGSTVTLAEIKLIWCARMIPLEDWVTLRATRSELALEPREREYVVFASHFAWAFSLFATGSFDFFCTMMVTYGFHLLDFMPNAMAFMAMFALMCYNFVGVAPKVDLFTHFFIPRTEDKNHRSGNVNWILRAMKETWDTSLANIAGSGKSGGAIGVGSRMLKPSISILHGELVSRAAVTGAAWAFLMTSFARQAAGWMHDCDASGVKPDWAIPSLEDTWVSSLEERSSNEEYNLTAPTRDAERAFITARIGEYKQVRAAQGTSSGNEGEEKATLPERRTRIFPREKLSGWSLPGLDLSRPRASCRRDEDEGLLAHRTKWAKSASQRDPTTDTGLMGDAGENPTSSPLASLHHEIEEKSPSHGGDEDRHPPTP